VWSLASVGRLLLFFSMMFRPDLRLLGSLLLAYGAGLPAELVVVELELLRVGWDEARQR